MSHEAVPNPATFSRGDGAHSDNDDARRVALQVCAPVAGGIRSHLRLLVPALAERGWSAPLCGPPGVLDTPADYPAVLSIGRRSGSFLAGVRTLRRAAAHEQPAIVHAHGLKAGAAALLGTRGAPLIVTAHNVVLPEVEGRSFAALKRIERWVFSSADLVIAPSRQVADDLSGDVPSANVATLLPAFPPPVVADSAETVRASWPRPVTGRWVVVPARLHPQKNLLAMLDVAAMMKERFGDIRFTILGHGPQRAELEAAVRRMGLDGVVELPGTVPNAPSVMAAADAVAFTSWWEGVPLSIPEAVWVGAPVVCPPVGVAPDMVVGDRGVVVRDRSTEAFCDALAEVFSRPRPVGDRSGLEPGPLVDELLNMYRKLAGCR